MSVYHVRGIRHNFDERSIISVFAQLKLAVGGGGGNGNIAHVAATERTSRFSIYCGGRSLQR